MLVGVRRKKDSAQWLAKRVYASRQIQILQNMQAPLIDPHLVPLVEVNQACVKRPMRRGRQSDAVLHLVGAAVCPDRENVCGINQSQLHAGHSAPIPVSEEHPCLKAASRVNRLTSVTTRCRSILRVSTWRRGTS